MMKFDLKYNINNITFGEHRSGFKFIMELLQQFECADGILLDGYLDYSFGWKLNILKSKNLLPYKRSWIGFVHNPPNIPPWVKTLSTEELVDCKDFKENLILCKGIFTFSNYLTNKLKERLDVPIITLRHPTEFPDKVFNLNSFLKEKKIIQMGSWLRCRSIFHELKATDYMKIQIIRRNSIKVFLDELKYFNITFKDIKNSDTSIVDFVDNNLYDNLLSSSVVFDNIFDSSANNTVIECISRNTPIFINKLESIVEYLGDNYPLYYEDINEVSEMLKDDLLIAKASLYLQNLPIRYELKGEYFLKKLSDSLIFL
ncbi:hypothetical protein [Pedobacter glucosidilyticus]|uniref:hypothetical protein n=1 Tax=Pedobacter glucosidilyticus TaxID=1122941 RepID=UPI0026EBB254|nr:hypothetical protein [Pedobacter glucosidilyticus]